MKPFSYLLAPSLLATNHGHLASGLREIEKEKLQWVHLDIMDGHFVPNLSFGPQLLTDLRPTSPLFFDTHLMMQNPLSYLEAFAKAGANGITVHIEPDYSIKEALTTIKRLGCKVGLALNPNTNPNHLKPFLSQVNLILVMTVFPGFGGQAFHPEGLATIAQFAQWRREGLGTYRIQVDGGINVDTAAQCRSHGADTFVCGTAFFKAKNRRSFVREVCLH